MPKKLLIVDDDPGIRRLFCRIFDGEEYQVLSARDGEEALSATERGRPDLVVLDINMPRLNGYQVCGRLRAGTATRHLPILMLSAGAGLSDKLPGFELGADDYVVKPFNPQELKARVEALLARSQSYLAANPLTRLPGSPAIAMEVVRRLKTAGPLAFAYVDLDFFKAYNDAYGYEKGDRMLLGTASVLSEVVQAHGAPCDMVGHVGGDDFVVISDPTRILRIAESVVEKFEQRVAASYDPLDRERGYVEMKNRLGNVQRFPLVSLSMGIVTNDHKNLVSYAQVAGLASEMKRYLKSQAGQGRSRFALGRPELLGPFLPRLL